MDCINYAISLAKEWQTLITGFMAIGAALIASSPVKRQLKLMRHQTDMIMRPTIEKMIEQTDDKIKYLYHNWPTIGFVKMPRHLQAAVSSEDITTHLKNLSQLKASIRSGLSSIISELAKNEEPYYIEHDKDKLSSSINTLLDSLDSLFEMNDKKLQIEMIKRIIPLFETTYSCRSDLIKMYDVYRLALSKQLKAIDDRILNISA